MRRVSVGINNLGKILIVFIGLTIGILIPIIWMPTLKILVGIPLTLYLILVSGWVYSRLRGAAFERLEIVRVIPERVLNGDVVEVILEIRNRSFLSIYNVEYVDYYPETCRKVDDGYRGSILVPPYSRVRIKYRIRVEGVGTHRFGPIYLKAYDPFTIYTIELYDDSVENNTVKCLPRSLSELDNLELDIRRRYLVGLHRTVELGYSMEFKDIRRYVPGDIIRFIDWKATARRGRLMIREFYREVENDIVIIIKLSIGMLAGRLGRRKYDYVVETVSKIGMSMINTNDRLGLIILGGYEPIVLPLKRMRIESFRNLMDVLASVPFDIPSDTKGLFDVGEVLSRLGLRGKALFIFISDLEDMGDVDLVEMLRSMKHTVYVLSPSTTRFVAEDMDGRERITFRILRYREDRVRNILMDRLLSLDVLAIDVGPDTLLEEIIDKMARFRRLTPT